VKVADKLRRGTAEAPGDASGMRLRAGRAVHAIDDSPVLIAQRHRLKELFGALPDASSPDHAAKAWAPAPVALSAAPGQPVQRVMHGVPRYTLHQPAALSPAATTRLQNALTALTAALHADPNIDVQEIVLSVEREGGPDFQGGVSTITGENPAETISVAGMPFPSIQITLQRAFGEVATEGELLGLLVHEVGAHNIPSDFRGVHDQGVYQWGPIVTPRKQSKGNTPSGGYEFQDFPHGPVPYQDPLGRQHDHIMLTDTLRPPVAAAGLRRADVYLETLLHAGDAIWNGGGTVGERRTKAEELVHIYLVDIARIAASDDGRMPPQSHALAINDLYDLTFRQVVLPLRGAAHPWIPASRPKANLFTLGYSLISFLHRVRKEKERNG
jgi:hypothetical protein